LLYFIIIQGHDYLFSTDKDVYLENLVKILNISIIYFEASSNELMKNKTFGEFKYNIKIGYIIKEKLFCFVTKIPQK
jgi:soluble P-type ATPase